MSTTTAPRPSRRTRRLTGRPQFYRSYAQELALFNTRPKLVSVGAIIVFFAVSCKWLPNVPIAWTDVWMGAFITAILFSVGRFAIGLYLGRSATASAYGAAGTLVVLLLWLYYSAQVFLLGAEFTCLYAKHRARSRTASFGC